MVESVSPSCVNSAAIIAAFSGDVDSNILHAIAVIKAARSHGFTTTPLFNICKGFCSVNEVQLPEKGAYIS